MYFLVMFSAAPKTKDSDEEDDNKGEKKGKKDKLVSQQKPSKKTVETSSGTKTKAFECQCCCFVSRFY